MYHVCLLFYSFRLEVDLLDGKPPPFKSDINELWGLDIEENEETNNWNIC